MGREGGRALDWTFAATVFFLALGVSFASGLLGIGGGIIMTPLLLYLPPAVGLTPLDMREVAGLTMVQGLFGAASGVLRHNKYGFVSRSLVAYMGSTIAVCSLLGAVLSRSVTADALQAVFAVLAAVAAGLMFLPKREGDKIGHDGSLKFNRPLAIAVAATVGGLGGLVGQGGAFILIPLMLYVLGLPTRLTLGSSLGIVLFSALAGFAGKLGTGQIDLFLAGFLVVGAVPGAQLGGFLSKRVSAGRLRLLLAILILLTAVKMIYELLV
ncbi:MAG: sulfite exporter TauE/SafE family protein [Chloroflexi bacterium]|nr:sulfite exporter TauE/SafE family protein [Chloroflexota bacterium]